MTQRELHRILTSPAYDTTEAALLVHPSWNQVKSADPLTQLYPDCPPPQSTCSLHEGCDFLSLSFRADILDLALTIRCNRLKLLPPHFGSSRLRMQNILQRKWWIAKYPNLRGSPEMHLPSLQVQSEILSLCGTLYRSSFSSNNEADSMRRRVIPVNSCLKHTQEIDHISPQWFRLLKVTHRSSNLRRKLESVITQPGHKYPMSRRERLMDELSPFLYPALESMEFPVTQRRKLNGNLREIPSSFPPSEFKVCHEFPGRLKRSPFCKVSFHWAVDALDFKEEEDVDCISIGDSHLQPLKIDKLGNHCIYYLPLYADQKSDSAVDLEKLAGTIGDDALFVQPVGFAAPLWELDAGIRATSPEPEKKDDSSPIGVLSDTNSSGLSDFHADSTQGRDLLDFLAIGHKILAGFVHSFL